MKQPDPELFGGGQYVVPISPDAAKSGVSVPRVAAEMPYPHAQAVKLADRPETLIVVGCREKERFDRYPLPYMDKRFRDKNGQLAMRTGDVMTQTADEARRYFVEGKLYLADGQCFKYTEFAEKGVSYGVLKSASGKQVFLPPVDELGTHLPDVASRGNEIVALDDRRYISAETAWRIKADMRREQRQQPKPARQNKDYER